MTTELKSAAEADSLSDVTIVIASASDDPTSSAPAVVEDDSWRSLPRVSVDLIGKVHSAQQLHGFKEGEYQSYRRWCSSHIHALRSRSGLLCVDPHNKQDPATQRSSKRKKKKGGKPKVRKGKGPIRSVYKLANPGWNPKSGIPKAFRDAQKAAKAADGPYVYRKVKPADVFDDAKLTESSVETEIETETTKSKAMPKGKGKGKWAAKKVKKKKRKKKSSCRSRDALLIPLFLSERALAYSLQLIDEYDEESLRKRHSAMTKLRKAMNWCRDLHELCKARCDALTILCSLAYLKLVQCQYFWHKEQPALMLRSHSVLTYLTDSVLIECANSRQMAARLKELALFKEMDQKCHIALEQLEHAATAGAGADEMKFDIGTLMSEIQSSTQKYVTDECPEYRTAIEDYKKTAAASALMTEHFSGKGADDANVQVVEIVWAQNGGAILRQEFVSSAAVSRVKSLRGILESDCATQKRKLNEATKLCNELLNGFEEKRKRRKTKRKPVLSKDKLQTVEWTPELRRYFEFERNRLKLWHASAFYFNQWAKTHFADSQPAFVLGDAKSKFVDAALHVKLAKFCEDALATCDSLSAAIVALATDSFVRFVEVTRRAFELLRSAHISFIYYCNEEFDKSAALFNGPVVSELQAFCGSEALCLTELNPVSGGELLSALRLALKKAELCQVASEASLQLQKATAKELEKASTLPKYLSERLDEPFPVGAGIEASNEMADAIYSLDSSPQMVLPKPVLFDLAWNHIAYDFAPKAADSEEDAEAKAEETTEQKEEPRSRWFGIF